MDTLVGALTVLWFFGFLLWVFATVHIWVWLFVFKKGAELSSRAVFARVFPTMPVDVEGVGRCIVRGLDREGSWCDTYRGAHVAIVEHVESGTRFTIDHRRWRQSVTVVETSASSGTA